MVAVEFLIGAAYNVKVERSPIHFYFTIKTQHNLWIRIDNANHSIRANEPFRLQLPGKTYVIGIQSTMLLGRGSRILFKHWEDGETSNPRTVDLSQDTAITAVYVTQHLLEVRSRYGQTSGEGWYDSGTMAQLSVSPTIVEEGLLQHQFDRWEGDISTTTSSSTILMDGPKVVTAVWRTALPTALILILLVIAGSCAAIPLLIVIRRKTPRPSRIYGISAVPVRGPVQTRVAACPRCNHLLRWIPESQRWYCDSCARYS